MACWSPNCRYALSWIHWYNRRHCWIFINRECRQGGTGRLTHHNRDKNSSVDIHPSNTMERVGRRSSLQCRWGYIWLTNWLRRLGLVTSNGGKPASYETHFECPWFIYSVLYSRALKVVKGCTLGFCAWGRVGREGSTIGSRCEYLYENLQSAKSGRCDLSPVSHTKTFRCYMKLAVIRSDSRSQ